jgi:hypothetical protein
VRRFLFYVARLVREKLIEVHAYSVLTTHFHLLVRSVDGQLSEAMRQIQNFYVRDFNRVRRRDGPLFRGRFGSIPVNSVRYTHALVRYIDLNAVQAGLARRAVEHPYGSAQYHAGLRRPPPWLSLGVIDAFLRDDLGSSSRLEAYEAVFPSAPPSLSSFVERRILHRARGHDPLDVVVGAPGARVLDWMNRKSRLGDGTSPGLPTLEPGVVREVVAALVDLPAASHSAHSRSVASAKTLLTTGLLRDLAGDSFRSIGRQTGVGDSQARRNHEAHRKALDGSPEYSAWAERALETCLLQTFGSFPSLQRRLASLAREIRAGIPHGARAA